MKKYLLIITAFAIGLNLMAQDLTTDTISDDSSLPTIVMVDTEYDDTQSSTDISSFLQSSRDAFNNMAAYNLSSRRFRIRAYDSKYTDVLINGVLMNDPDGGRPYYSNWGGLNDVMRNSVTMINSGITYESFGGPGGVTAITTRASNYRKQISLGYSLSNRSYAHRVMASIGTGMMENGWAFAASVSGRYTPQNSLFAWNDGTWYNGSSYFLSAEKKLNNKHSLGFLVFGSPSQRAASSPAVQEAFDLLGTNYYNPNWGLQTDKNGNHFMRNARVSSYHQPMFQLQHYWHPNERTSINTTAYFWFGKSGTTSLEWGEAPDPRPDYYKNLPSYYYSKINGDDYTLEGYEAYKKQWIEDISMHQINWDNLYSYNYANLKTINNANNTEGNTIHGIFSKYIIEERRQDKQQYGLTSTVKYEFNPYLHLYGGFRAGVSKTHYYKKIADLLGGDYYLDIDKYAEGEAFEITDEQQTNIRNKNHVATVGDIIGYDYIANVNKVVLWGELTYVKNRWSTYMGVEADYTQMYRAGNFENGRFLGSESYGNSSVLDLINGSFKMGGSYALNGRNYVVANVMMKSQAPDFRSVFVAPRVRNTIIDDVDNEKILSFDLGYEYRSPFMKARVAAYRTQFYDLTWNRSFYYEATGKYVNYVMNDIEQVSQGVEVGADINITPTISAQLAGTIGEHRYSNNPKVYVNEDNNANPIYTGETVYLENYYVGEMPQTAGAIGLKYNSPKYWWVSLTGNFFANYYLAVNPTNHTTEAVDEVKAKNPDNLDKLLEQKKLDDAFTLDFYGGKSWNIKGYTVLLSISVNNILNNQDIVLYGYEQLRSDYSDLDKFPEKYSYLYGTNFFASLAVRF